MKPHIILASASIGRKGLLEKLGVAFTVLPSTVDEEKIMDKDPYIRIQHRARVKAEDVTEKVILGTIRQLAERTPESDSGRAALARMTDSFLVIAADSEALLNGKTYGKSKNKKHAKQIISDLMGHTHEFLTATCIIHLQLVKNNSPIPPLKKRGPGGVVKKIKRWEEITKSYVTLRKMSETELAEYISRYDFSRFAAGYTLNETPWDLITKIEGSYTNVIGLPFEVVLPVFRRIKVL